MIDWLDWDGASNVQNCTYTIGQTPRQGRCLPANGGSSTMWSTPTHLGSAVDAITATTWNYYRSTQCTLTPTYRAGNNGILLYSPGAYRGDGLARLYNDGQNYEAGGQALSTGTDGDYLSGYTIGLANQLEGSRNNPQTVTFNVTCSTYLLKTEQEGLTKAQVPALAANPDSARVMPMEGMVVADAESSNWDATHKESIAVSSQQSQYQLLESAKTPGCSTSSLAEWDTWNDSRGAHSGYRIHSDRPQCSTENPERGYGPVAVMFMRGATSLDVQVVGNGRSAVALGVVSYLDFGDAPETYGVAGASFQPTWRGGVISGRTANLTNQWPWASVADPSIKLGATIDAETRPLYTGDAKGDDRTGTADEDGWTVPEDGIRVQAGDTYTTTVQCSGEALVRGWIDWNRNGLFDDASERSTASHCAGGGASLRWRVPADVKRSVAGEPGSDDAYVRFRISGDKVSGSLVPPPSTGVTATGEVEDYKVPVRVPTLQLVKHVDNTAVGPLGLAADRWTLTATSTPKVEGAGAAPETAIKAGSVALSEASTDPSAVAYEASAWSCREADGTLPGGIAFSSSVSSAPGAGSGSVQVKNQDRVICEITNTAKPASLTWTKTAADGATPLPGSQWTLTPTDPAGDPILIADNDASDADQADGAFRLTGLKWGEYSLVESRAPAGYRPSTEVKTLSVNGATPNLSADFGAVINTPIPVDIAWKKVDERGNVLSGSQWRLTGTGIDGKQVGLDPIMDCEGTCAADSLDKDVAKGAFKLKGLSYGTYSLEETRAPVGYVRETAVRTIIIEAVPQTDPSKPVQAKITVVTPEGASTPAGTAVSAVDVPTADPVLVRVGDIVNNKVEVPPLPLTGGMSTDSFLVLGGGALGLAGLATLFQRRRSRA